MEAKSTVTVSHRTLIKHIIFPLINLSLIKIFSVTVLHQARIHDPTSFETGVICKFFFICTKIQKTEKGGHQT